MRKRTEVGKEETKEKESFVEDALGIALVLRL